MSVLKIFYFNYAKFGDLHFAIIGQKKITVTDKYDKGTFEHWQK